MFVRCLVTRRMRRINSLAQTRGGQLVDMSAHNAGDAELDKYDDDADIYIYMAMTMMVTMR